MPIPSEKKLQQFSLNALRIATGFLFFPHGAKKLFGWFGGDPAATVDLFSLMGLAGVIEFFGGLLILAGLFTRPVAAIASLEMFGAMAKAHWPEGFWPALNGGELALFYAFVFLLIAAFGGGRFSLDGLLRERREATPQPQTRSAGEAATA